MGDEVEEEKDPVVSDPFLVDIGGDREKEEGRESEGDEMEVAEAGKDEGKMADEGKGDERAE